jgi:hypothetical protein
MMEKVEICAKLSKYVKMEADAFFPPAIMQ